MSNEYKDWVADRKQDTVTEKLNRLTEYLDDLNKFGDMEYGIYSLLHDLVVEISEDVEKLEYEYCGGLKQDY